MKKLLSLLLLFSTMLLLASCGGDDDDDTTPTEPTDQTISVGELTEDATWEGGNTYILDGVL